MERAKDAPGLQPFWGPPVAGFGDGARFVEGTFDLFDAGSIADCVAGGVADQALASEDPGRNGERMERHWARFRPRFWLPEDRAARVWWCSSAA